eukprot:2304880-Ditylum_brightwellii.AAC.1
MNDNENSKISQEEEYEEKEDSGSDEEDKDCSNGDVLIEEVEEENTLITQIEENENSKVVTMSPQVYTRKQRLLVLGQSGAIDPAWKKENMKRNWEQNYEIGNPMETKDPAHSCFQCIDPNGITLNDNNLDITLLCEMMLEY